MQGFSREFLPLCGVFVSTGIGEFQPASVTRA
jgi:hypothetical protein